MTINDREGGFFYPILTRIMDSISCSLPNTAFYIEKSRDPPPPPPPHPENPEFAEMRHRDAILT